MVKGVVNDMCSYTTSSDMEVVENADGTSSSASVIYCFVVQEITIQIYLIRVVYLLCLCRDKFVK